MMVNASIPYLVFFVILLLGLCDMSEAGILLRDDYSIQTLDFRSEFADILIRAGFIDVI